MTTTTQPTPVLDFNPTVGMIIDGAPPERPEIQPWAVECVFAAGFPGPPLHVHPNMQERFEDPPHFRATSHYRVLELRRLPTELQTDPPESEER